MVKKVVGEVRTQSGEPRGVSSRSRHILVGIDTTGGGGGGRKRQQRGVQRRASSQSASAQVWRGHWQWKGRRGPLRSIREIHLVACRMTMRLCPPLPPTHQPTTVGRTDNLAQCTKVAGQPVIGEPFPPLAAACQKSKKPLTSTAKSTVCRDRAVGSRHQRSHGHSPTLFFSTADANAWSDRLIGLEASGSGDPSADPRSRSLFIFFSVYLFFCIELRTRCRPYQRLMDATMQVAVR